MLHSFNCIEYPVVFLALNRLGAVCSPSSPMFNAQELYDQATLAKVCCVTINTRILSYTLCEHTSLSPLLRIVLGQGDHFAQSARAGRRGRRQARWNRP